MPHTSPARKLKPGVPAVSTSGASCPVRPRRPSRTQAPIASGWRCGARSRHHRPLRSSSSVARAGIGRAGQRPPSWYGAVASFVTRCRTCRTPDVVSSRSTSRRRPACWSAAVTLAVRWPSTSTEVTCSRGDQSAPSARSPDEPGPHGPAVRRKGQQAATRRAGPARRAAPAAPPRRPPRPRRSPGRAVAPSAGRRAGPPAGREPAAATRCRCAGGRVTCHRAAVWRAARWRRCCWSSLDRP